MNSPHFMDKNCPLPWSQHPATFLILNQSIPGLGLPCYWRFILILSSRLFQGLPNGVFPSRLPIKSVYAPLLPPICTTCSAYLVLALITRNLFGKEFESFAWFPSWFHSVPLDKLWDKISHLDRTAASLIIISNLFWCVLRHIWTCEVMYMCVDTTVSN